MTAPLARLELVAISDGLEALALRAALEWWGVQVNLHLIGQAQDVVDLLGGGRPLAPIIVLACHGDDEGIRLPPLAPEIEAAQPYHQVLTPANLAEFARLNGSTVVSNGCATGTPALAQAFLGAGARAYIGPDDYPRGDASLFYTLHLCYAWLCQGAPLADAHAQASAHDDQTGMFRLFEKD